MTSITEATHQAVEAAKRAGIITDADAGSVAVLLHLAEAIDAQEDGLTPSGKLDNVSVPTYLKFAEALGLSPKARKAGGFDLQVTDAPRIGRFRAVAGGKTA
ncbi:hypothetical protein NNL26_06955 [Micrococcus luteus]|uniref:terminase small subunit n=1 Tax=Micrococcus luteus TaxID=1270 RepID=UPI002103DEE6|nr:hypothetical protein [Micrococcus luteus]UTX33736.1 hypothetical protein NNL26_06955 [Micrococcus luteus]